MAIVRLLRALVRSTLALERARPGEIGIRLSDDAELRALNRQWRGIDRATDEEIRADLQNFVDDFVKAGLIVRR